MHKIDDIMRIRNINRVKTEHSAQTRSKEAKELRTRNAWHGSIDRDSSTIYKK